MIMPDYYITKTAKWLFYQSSVDGSSKRRKV